MTRLASSVAAAAAGLPPGVRFIQRDWLSANHVLLVDADQAVLVDTGFASNTTRTLALVETALAQESARGLVRIINTHLHSDHCGGNAALQARYGCRVSVPASVFEAVRDWDSTALTFESMAQPCPRFAADDAIAPGDEFEAGGLRWVGHAAPGHDPDSLIYFAPASGLLISADALWSHGFGAIFPELQDNPGFAEQRAVLDLIEALEPRLVLPGHGPMFDDVPAALARARSRLDAYVEDPNRHLRYGLKALLKFRLLYMGSESLDEMTTAMARADVLHDAAHKLGWDMRTALAWASEALVKGGQAERRGERICNRD